MRALSILLALVLCGCPPPAREQKSHETVEWERIGTPDGFGYLGRTRVPGGWLVCRGNSNSAPCYVPDEGAAWLSSGVEAR